MSLALPDVNVAFALADAEHEHAPAARAWLEGRNEPGSVGLCRVVQMGLLRLPTGRAAMRERTLSAETAWGLWERLLEDDRFVFAEEPPGIDARWRGIVEALPSGAGLGTDTYLAAFARGGGWTLVTFDGGFRRFPGLSLELLAP